MTRTTFCPHHILDINPRLEPEVVEKFFIRPLVEFINKALDNKLIVSVSKELVNQFELLHPWHLINDKKWKGWIKDWYAVLKQLLTKIEVLAHTLTQKAHVTRCGNLSSNINGIFCDYLDTIATHTLPGRNNEESVFTPTPLCSNFNDFITISNAQEVKFAKYTWYKIYPNTLPCEGELPFIPPVNWRRSAQVLRENAPHLGYLDCNGRAWRWDLLHKNHWDVQDVGGGKDKYTNVSTEGKILDD